MNQPTLYIIQGFIASGKTTFSTKLAKETQSLHLNPDKIVTELYSKDEYMKNWNNCYDRALEKMWQLAQKYLNNGQNVILDMGFWKKIDRDYAKEIAKKCNAVFKHIYLYVPDNIAKDRILTTRPAEWAKIHLDNFDKNKKLFEAPQKDEDFIKINNF